MNALCDVTSSTLILIDLQARLMPAIHEGNHVVNRAVMLARVANLLDVPVIVTEQNPDRLGHLIDGFEAIDYQRAQKHHFDASVEASFIDKLDPQRDELIVAGCEAHVCVLQSVLGLLGRGYRVRLVVDAIGSRHPQDRAAAIDRMGAAGAVPVTTEMVAFEWLRHSHHPDFKRVLELVKR